MVRYTDEKPPSSRFEENKRKAIQIRAAKVTERRIDYLKKLLDKEIDRRRDLEEKCLREEEEQKKRHLAEAEASREWKQKIQRVTDERLRKEDQNFKESLKEEAEQDTFMDEDTDIDEDIDQDPEVAGVEPAFKPTETQAKYLQVLDRGDNVFLTGPGGCGKTALINHFLDPKRERRIEDAMFELENYPHRFAAFEVPEDVLNNTTDQDQDLDPDREKNKKELDELLLHGLLRPCNASKFSPAAVCPTGVAATQIRNGNTIHSVYRLNHTDKDFQTIRDTHHDFSNNCPIKKKVATILGSQRIVLEEVSMIGDQLFEGLDLYTRVTKEVGDRAFGGAQVIASGDFMQLSPINQKFCFESFSWQACGFYVLLMTESVRQKGDAKFSLFLRKLRMGRVTHRDLAPYTKPSRLAELKKSMMDTKTKTSNEETTQAQTLRATDKTAGKTPGKIGTKRPKVEQLTDSLIQTRVIEATTGSETNTVVGPTFITGTNKVCAKLNGEELSNKVQALPSWEKPRNFPRVIKVLVPRYYTTIEEQCTNIPNNVLLCTGCKVRFTAPIYSESIVNGTKGLVIGIRKQEQDEQGQGQGKSGAKLGYTVFVLVSGSRGNILKYNTTKVIEVQTKIKEILAPCKDLSDKEISQLEVPFEAKQDGSNSSPWRVVGTCEYLALVVFYATTIHSAQGLTISDPLILNTGDYGPNRPAFIYVAASRLNIGKNLFIVDSAEQTNNYLLGKRAEVEESWGRPLKKKRKTDNQTSQDVQHNVPPPQIDANKLLAKVVVNPECLDFYQQLESRTDDELTSPFRLLPKIDEKSMEVMHNVWAVLKSSVENGMYIEASQDWTSRPLALGLCVYDLYKLSANVMVGLLKSPTVVVDPVATTASGIYEELSALNEDKRGQFKTFANFFNNYLLLTAKADATVGANGGLVECVKWLWEDKTNSANKIYNSVAGTKCGGTVEPFKYVPGFFYQPSYDGESFTFTNKRIKEISAERKLELEQQKLDATAKRKPKKVQDDFDCDDFDCDEGRVIDDDFDQDPNSNVTDDFDKGHVDDDFDQDSEFGENEGEFDQGEFNENYDEFYDPHRFL